MKTGWQEVLTRPQAGDHIAQLYQDPEFLIDAVAHFVAAGLASGEAVVLIMRHAHWENLKRRLAQSGADPAAAVERGQLHYYEAATTLASLMKNGMPDAAAFKEVIGGAVTKARRHRSGVRAFGEMVVLLCQRGEAEAAVELEALWNEVAARHRVKLLCSYPLDVVEGRNRPLASRLRDAHSHAVN